MPLQSEHAPYFYRQGSMPPNLLYSIYFTKPHGEKASHQALQSERNILRIKNKLNK